MQRAERRGRMNHRAVGQALLYMSGHGGQRVSHGARREAACRGGKFGGLGGQGGGSRRLSMGMGAIVAQGHGPFRNVALLRVYPSAL